MSVQIVQHINGLKAQARREYDRAINRDLSRHQFEGMLKRNITTVLQQVYKQAIEDVNNLVTDNHEHIVNVVIRALDGFGADMMGYVLQKHRGSCAISNFTMEHNPSPAYINETLEQLEKDWQAFVNALTAMR